MNHLLQSRTERLDSLAMIYHQLIQRTEHIGCVMNQLERRQQEHREQLATIKRQIDELQLKIEAEKARQKTA